MSKAEGFGGGCQCKKVIYRIQLKQLVAYACHCSECKKQSTSSYAISVPVPADSLFLSGKTQIFQRPADSGAITRCFFCGECGTRIYHQSESSPEIVTIKGGTLDSVSELSLAAHLWVKRKHTWIVLPKEVQAFETQPTDLRAWRQKLMANIQVIAP